MRRGFGGPACPGAAPTLLVWVMLAFSPCMPAAAGDDGGRTKVTLQGIALEFSTKPPVLREGEYAEVAFRVTDPRTGNPIGSLKPAAWMDPQRKGYGPQDCRGKVAGYLRGTLNDRPMVDLNTAFLLVLNKDASISVIDPNVSLAGITSMYAQVLLLSPGEDWAVSGDRRRLYVTMPKAGQVAVVDTESFKVTANVPAGSRPVRAALQPDGKYLWIGNDAPTREESGAAVVDAGEKKMIARIPTGAGHHEIAFSEDDRFAFVSNLEEGTVSVIDIRKLEKVRDIKTGPRPAAMAYSGLAKALYVADATEGTISAIDGATHAVVARIRAKPGLNALRFSPDGRYGIALCGEADAVFVFDVSTNTIRHTLAVTGRPYKVSLTDAFAYIRRLSSEYVAMIPLALLGKEDGLGVKEFAAGTAPPDRGSYIGIADAIVPAAEPGAVLVLNPGDNFIYYYMEGMTAPMGQYRNAGHEAKAIALADRSLKETSPGVYAGTVLVPQAGEWSIAFLLDAPRAVHCFNVAVAENPAFRKVTEPLSVEFLTKTRDVAAGGTARISFRLTDPASGAPRPGLADVLVRSTRSPGPYQDRVYAVHRGDGVYDVELPVREPGAYYVTVECASLKARPEQLRFFTFKASKSVSPPPGSPAQGREDRK